MTGLRVVARLLIAAPITADDGAAVAVLLHAYAPTALHRLDGAEAGAVGDVVAAALGLRSTPVDGPEALPALEAVALRALGGCVAVLVPTAAVPGLLARALGAPAEAAARIRVVPRAISVLECDDAARWSVVRVNEGALPLPEA